MQNHIVRRVDAKTGKINTVVGTGRRGYNGDEGATNNIQLSSPHSIALDGDSHLYVADTGNHRIRRVDLQHGRIETIAGTGAKTLPRPGQRAKGNPIVGPRALFIDGRILWIVLREGHSVWKMDLDRGVLWHVAGTGEPGYSGDGGPALKATFNGPKGIAVGGDGNVDVVDTENQVIRRIYVRSGIIRTIAGVGPDDAGSVYIGDTNNHRVRRVRFSN
jgi:streptogramin lyase